VTDNAIIVFYHHLEAYRSQVALRSPMKVHLEETWRGALPNVGALQGHCLKAGTGRRSRGINVYMPIGKNDTLSVITI
jgi:hypothetical protein